jgi:hypothetical protein
LRLEADGYRVMGHDNSVRRILLGTALVLLVLLDLSVVYHALQSIAVGREFGALGIGNIGIGFAVLQIPALLALLWLTHAVWSALRRGDRARQR